MFRRTLSIAAALTFGLGSAAAHAGVLAPSSDHDFGWTQNGWQMAFVSDRDGDMEIYTMRVDGSDVRRLTHSAGLDILPVISPDGARIAFVTTRDGQEEVYVMAFDGSGQARVTADAAWDFNPGFSGDGRQLFFDSSRSGAIERYVVDLDGAADRSARLARE